MEVIAHHSLTRAGDEAVRLWTLSSAQYPKQHKLMLDIATASVIEAASAFALNARRAMELLPPSEKFALSQSRWTWRAAKGAEVVKDLRDALNRIVHASVLDVGFEDLPNDVCAIEGGALVIPYLRATTDRRPRAMIDPFSLSHAFLYGVMPKLLLPMSRDESNN